MIILKNNNIFEKLKKITSYEKNASYFKLRFSSSWI